ncbi:hypothetical protein GALMADRAFT_209540 [Galerina marginata CBS 339.88]|uniref:F-box domain-containing protein n=1 Tax=Galerina marginata (strain CBS 339.88) TaxID=685588 RepID=A0A067TDW8_GALM3|nr:hypothetical protein GALMADRAFT_209540 [Galerina marginata CBS 339.88]
MIELPNEIWPLIASFLSVGELWNIRGLNKPFYHIALDEHYRMVKVDIGRSPSGEYSHSLLRLCDENVAGRVREIDYCQTSSPQDWRNQSSNKPRNRFLSLKQRIRGTPPIGTKIVMNAITNLKNVSSVRIHTFIPLTKYSKEWKPILHAGLGAHSESTRSLSLVIPFENMSELVPSFITLPRLQSLSISLLLPYSRREGLEATFSTTVTSTIVPFINRHRLSLHSIDMRLPSSPALDYIPIFGPVDPPNLDMSLLFKGLHHIPHLASASFSISALTDPNLISGFLQVHSGTMLHLDISLTGDITPLIDRIFGLSQLPLVESFSVDYQNYLKDVIVNNPITKFMHRNSSSLTSLKVLGKFHRRAELLDLFSQAADTLVFYSKLRHLTVGVHSLTPEIVDIISFRLFALEDLHLHVRWFKRRDESTHNEEYEFCLEMNRRTYPDWQLRHLTVMKTDQRNRKSGVNYCITAMAEALPSLQTFNGVSRSEYLAKAPSITTGIDKHDRLPWDSTRT